MKHFIRNCSIAIALTVGASSAQAVTVAEAQAGTQVYVSGATAPTIVFNRYLTLSDVDGGIFTAGTIRRFEGTTSAGGSDASITCGEVTTAAASGIGALTAGDVVCIHKGDHGSGDGTGPVANSTTVDFLDISAVGSTDCAASTAAAAGTIPDLGNHAALDIHNGCSAESLVVPHAGVADVEPRLFFVDPASLDSDSLFAIIWGLPVSIPWYQTLQAVQFPNTSTCNPANANYDSGDGVADGVADEAACVPSMKANDVRTWFTGGFTDIKFYLDDNGDFITANADVVAAGLAPADYDGNPATDQAYLCRRRTGSGTQASYEAIYLRQRCEAGVLGMSLPNSTEDLTGTGTPTDVDAGGDGLNVDPSANAAKALETVFAGRGSSDVRECLDGHSDAGTYAIGIFSTEANPLEESNPQRDGYRHVRVDGVLPSTLNAVEGHYEWLTELVCNTRPGEDTSVDEVEIARELVCDPAPASSLLSDFGVIDQPWGQGGILALNNTAGNGIPQGTFPLDDADVAANPTWLYTKSAGAAGTNNCNPPVKGSTGFVFTPANVDSQ